MKIRIIISIILFILLVSACKNNKLQTENVIIAGKILNYEDDSDQNTIEFIFGYLLRMDEKHVARIDENGNFKIEIPCSYIQDFYIIYGRLATLFCSPGDSLFIEIDVKILNDKIDEEIINLIHITGGTNVVDNKHVLKFSVEKNKRRNWEKNKQIILESTPEKYKEYIYNKEQEYLTLLDSFNQNNKTSKLFKKWAKDNIKYGALKDLMEYQSNYTRYHKLILDSICVPLSYYTFLKDYNMNDNEIISINHNYFLLDYSMYITRELLPPDSLNQVKSLFKEKELTAAYAILINNILINTTGFTQEILLSNYYHNLLYWKKIKEFEELYNPELIQETFKNRIENKYKKLKSQIENPQFIYGTCINNVNNDIIKPILDTIISKHIGKVIYIDFWAPWCGACLSEMSFSEKQQNHFINQDVVFLFLANNCSEKIWKATIAEKQIKGDHYLLSKDQYNVLSDKFAITGIPHYVLIDKEGRIINDNATRPSQMKKLTEEINKLLK